MKNILLLILIMAGVSWGAVYTADFSTYSNQNPLAGSWSTCTPDGVKIVSGIALPSSDGNFGASYWSANTVADTQFSCVIINQTMNDNTYLYALCRQNNGDNYYAAFVSNGALALFKRESGGWSNLATNSSLNANWVANDSIIIVARGTRIIGYKNHTDSVVATDVSYSSGRVGFGLRYNQGNAKFWTGGTLGVACTNVSVTSNPKDTTIRVDGQATFRVTADGTTPSYQWEYSANGGTSYSNVASGGTSSEYTTGSATLSMDGYLYRCAISNSCPSTATSAACTLSVVNTNTIKLACIGNSITEGWGCPSYVDSLRVRLGSGYEVRNYGVHSKTQLKNGNEPYWATDMLARIRQYSPNVVTIMLGANDSKAGNFAHIAEYRGDLLAMIDTINTWQGTQKIHVAIPCPTWENSFDIIEANLQKIRDTINAVATQYEIDLFDCYTPLVPFQSYYSDGVHPNSAAADTISRVFYRGLNSPAITSIIPDSCPANGGKRIAINGSNFGASQGTLGSIKIGTDSTQTVFWSATICTTIVGSGYTRGSHDIILKKNDNLSTTGTTFFTLKPGTLTYTRSTQICTVGVAALQNNLTLQYDPADSIKLGTSAPAWLSIIKTGANYGRITSTTPATTEAISFPVYAYLGGIKMDSTLLTYSAIDTAQGCGVKVIQAAHGTIRRLP